MVEDQIDIRTSSTTELAISDNMVTTQIGDDLKSEIEALVGCICLALQ